MAEHKDVISASGREVEGPPLEDLRGRLTSWDLNMPEEEDEKAAGEVFVDEKGVMNEIALGEAEENSPYPEVRASVPAFDEEMPANTIRAWTLGLIFSIFGSGVNTLFSLRNPSISLGAIVAQLLSLACGRLWAKVMPNHEFNTFGLRWNLNPGPFNIKEHSVIVVMAGVSYGTAYATDIILAQVAFYGQHFGTTFRLLLVITTQCLGYGIAGLSRDILVYPASMIWPANLASVALMHSMHEKEIPDAPGVLGGKMSRFRWFGLVFLGMFLYYFIPGYLAQFLSAFAFMTWIFPNNVVVNQVFGASTGLSIFPITLDWTQVTGFVGDPLIAPWFAIANTMVGIVVFYIIASAGLHYGGAWYAEYLPMSDSSTYDNTGSPYNVSKIITKEFTLNATAYKEYSPLFLSTTFSISYGLSFASFAALITYTWLHYRHQIIAQFKKSRNESPDIHMKLMAKYPEAPWWWYMSITVVMMVLSLVVCLVWPTELTWWALIFAVVFSTVMTTPIGIIQAITNQQMGLNVITEFIFGYMQPGRPLAMMLFKTYGYITMAQALGFVGDLKFGHYMKIPPKTMFMCQVVATIVSCFVQVAVLDFALTSIPEVCTKKQPNHFTCPNAKVFFSASVIWGLIGPMRIFNPGQVYSILLIGFPIGVVLPVIFYYLAKWYPKSIFKYTMIPIILSGGALIPPATPLNYLSWGIVGYVFQKYIKTKYFNWWGRLNYITATGLDTGLAISTLVIFFIFTLNNIEAPQWWGNTVIGTTLDANDAAIQTVLGPGQTFGPKTW